MATAKKKTKKKTRLKGHKSRQSQVPPDQKKRLGRPSIFTEEKRQLIYKSLRDCPFLNPACGHAGISRRCLDNWLAQGTYDDDNGIESEYAIFLRKVNALRAEAESALFGVIKNQAKIDWVAAKYTLACMDSITYGQKAAVKVEDDNTKGGAVTNLHSELARMVAEIESED